jgi:pimeloyl-ACP methyl ester carboxylesterase
LGSSSETAEETWGGIWAKVWRIYGDDEKSAENNRRYFSYRPDSPDYDREDTEKPIAESVNVLRQTVDRILKEDANIKIDLIGHSLGGVVALEYVTLLYRENSDVLSHIHTVITLDSPVLGSKLLCQFDKLPPSFQKLIEMVWRSVRSKAANDLRDWGCHQKNRRINLLPIVLGLREKGVLLLSLTSKHDIVICAEEAAIPGFGGVYDLGNGLPKHLRAAGFILCEIPEVELKEEEFEIEGDAGEFSGHSRILHDQTAIKDIKTLLSR